VQQSYGEVYPELVQRGDLISDLILREEERFGVTIESGMNRLEDLIDDAKKRSEIAFGRRSLLALFEPGLSA
jgi:alanyl-tRNA synthetase